MVAGNKPAPPSSTFPAADRPAEAASPVGDGVGFDDGDGVEFAAEEGVDRVRDLGAQLVEDVRTTASALIDEQKSRAARQIDAVAEALRRTAHSLDQSTGRAFATYADQAAEQVEHLAVTVRERSWRAIRAEAEALARRQPALFMLGTVVLGLAGGRFLTASSARQHAWSPRYSPTVAGSRELH